MAALSQPGHYQAPWMPVFSSFVGWGIDSHSPGNDCHTGAKSQPPTGANHIKQGCQGALLVNRGNKHLLILTYSSAADTHRCALSRCLCWEKMYCLDLISLSLYTHTHTRTSTVPPAPPLPQSSSACVNLQPAETQKAAKVFKNALWMHDGGRLTLQGITKYTRMEMRYIQLSLSLWSWVTLDLNCMMFELHRSTGRWSELLFSLFYFPVPDVSIFPWSHTTVEVWYKSLRIKHMLKK